MFNSKTCLGFQTFELWSINHNMKENVFYVYTYASKDVSGAWNWERYRQQQQVCACVHLYGAPLSML